MDQKGEQQQQQHTADYAPYPKLDPKDITPPPAAASSTTTTTTTTTSAATTHSVIWNSENNVEATTTMPAESNPYISSSPAPPSSVKEKMDSLRDTLGEWGKRMVEATKKAEDLAGNMWQHLKTAPSVTDAAMGRLAQSTKVLAEGGYEKIFQQTFGTDPEEKLLNSYACYLSTSAGPIMGILYLSSAKLAFCSDNPLSYKVGDKTEWSYYKVVIPIHQLKAVNTSASPNNPAEKYINIMSVDNHEFWYIGFVNYDSAVKHLQDALQTRNLHSV